jgi:hypothetical protein
VIAVGAALTAGAGDLSLKFGALAMGGEGTATFGATGVLAQNPWNAYPDYWGRSRSWRRRCWPSPAEQQQVLPNEKADG